MIPVAGGDDLFPVPEVVQDIGGVATGLLNRWIATFMLGRNIGHVAGDLDQLMATIVWLPHDTLPGFGNVVLKTHDILKAQRFAELSRNLHRLVVDGVAPVKTDQGRCAVVAGEEFSPNQRPQGSVGIVVAHKNRNLEFDVHPQAVQQVAE